jgi:hypothetical protein
MSDFSPHPQQPPPQHQQTGKDSGIALGFKLVIGGCLALVVIVGGVFVACGVMVGGLSGLSSNTSRPSSSSSSSPSSSSSSTPSAKITLSQYNQVKDGMSYSQVAAILGAQGKPVSDSKFGSVKTEAYSWDGGNFASVSIIFQNNKVVSKSQFGLE